MAMNKSFTVEAQAGDVLRLLPPQPLGTTMGSRSYVDYVSCQLHRRCSKFPNLRYRWPLTLIKIG